EAKIAWLPHPKEIGRLSDALAEACREARCLHPESNSRRLGIAFGVFERPRASSEGATWSSGAIATVVDELKAKVPVDVVAWTVPSFAPDVTYAGCILMGRLV